MTVMSLYIPKYISNYYITYDVQCIHDTSNPIVNTTIYYITDLHVKI